MMRAIFAVLACTAATLAAASCADSRNEATPPADASLVVTPDADATVAPDVTSDATCGADGDPCPLTCAEAEFCPVATGIDARYLLTSLSGSSATNVWAVGSGGTVLRFDGNAWSIVPSGVPDTFHAVWTDGADVWIVGASKSIFRGRVPSSGSMAWTPMPATSPQTAGGRMLAAWGTGGEVHVGGEPLADFNPDLGESIAGNWLVYPAAVADAGADGGDAGVVDAGAPAARVMNGFGNQLTTCTVTAIWERSLADRWMACDNGDETAWQRGLLLHGETADGGDVAWTSIESQSSARFHSLWGTTTSVWAVGDVGTIRRWSPGATRFTVVPSGTSATLRGVWAASDDDVWAVGDGGTILHFDGQGVNVARMALPRGPKPDLRAIWGSGPNDIWIAGDGPLLHYTGPKPGSTGKDGGS